MSLEKKTLGRKGKYEALGYVQKNLPPKKKRRERESKRKWGRKWERVRVKCCKENELKSLVGWVKRKRELFIGWVMWVGAILVLGWGWKG